jgi:16S rRNA (guanine527-N7)-methyltransferase
MNLLIEWNDKINLTAITEPKEVIIKHFIDSLTIADKIENNSKIIDVGTGAGFPGIPLKIFNDTLNVTLLDSLNKRAIFLNEVIEKLNLKNIEVIHGRAEDYAKIGKYKQSTIMQFQEL